MAAASAGTPSRRPRPGSLERPVNGRLYRGTWLTRRAAASPGGFQRPRTHAPSVGDAASGVRPRERREPGRRARHELSRSDTGHLGRARRRKLVPVAARALRIQAGDRAPGREHRGPRTSFAPERPRACRRAIEPSDRRHGASRQQWGRPRRGRQRLRHRRPDRACSRLRGTALGRWRWRGPAAPAELHAHLPLDRRRRLRRAGAAEFVKHSRYRRNLPPLSTSTAIAGPGAPRLELSGDTARSPHRGARRHCGLSSGAGDGHRPARPSALRQLVDLGFPFSLYDHAPFVAPGIPAVTITAGPDKPPDSFRDTPEEIDVARLGQIGRATQNLLNALDGIDIPRGQTALPLPRGANHPSAGPSSSS